MQILFRPELDSELLDDRTKVLGVLAADNDGMCLMGKYVLQCAKRNNS